jgi:cell division septation protein DedD
MARSRLAALISALALLAPASAFAQSAGDEQYQDPFGGDDSSQSSDDSATAQATATPTPVPAAPATTAPTATAAQQSSAPAAQQLPRTGGDPITPAVAGFWLLLGGVALRARVRLHDRGA